PLLQVGAQRLFTHASVELGVGGQTLPQWPQFAGSLRASSSQPLRPSPSQSKKCCAQRKLHLPASQAAAAFAGAPHFVAQPPQLAGSPVRSISQPFARLPSQSACPCAHTVPHLPWKHAPRPNGTVWQRVPH